jgi:G:T/U-mismatch repair DNA glycosylase
MIHPWLEKYQIKEDSKYLIIGTHPPMLYCGKLEFYYGNMNEFWRFLNLVYIGHKLYNNGCPNIEDIIEFLEKSKLSITDIVYKTKVDRFSTDNEMGKINIDDLNPFLFKWLNESSIEVIYFTSIGGTNSAKNLFKKWYKFNFYEESKKYKITETHLNEIELWKRKIKLIDLFSPSPTARRSSPRIKEFKEWRLEKKENNDFDTFRVYWYKKYLPNI